jgi:hypothetical protein
MKANSSIVYFSQRVPNQDESLSVYKTSMCSTHRKFTYRQSIAHLRYLSALKFLSISSMVKNS